MTLYVLICQNVFNVSLCNEWLLMIIDIDNNAIGFDPHQKFLVSIVSIVDSSYNF